MQSRASVRRPGIFRCSAPPRSPAEGVLSCRPPPVLGVWSPVRSRADAARGAGLKRRPVPRKGAGALWLGDRLSCGSRAGPGGAGPPGCETQHPSRVRVPVPADPAHPVGLPLPGDPTRTVHPSALSFSGHLTPGHPSARHRGPSSVRGVNNPRDLGRRLRPRACLLHARAGGVPRAQGEGRRWALTPLAALRCHVRPTGTESGAQRGHRSSGPRRGGSSPTAAGPGCRAPHPHAHQQGQDPSTGAATRSPPLPDPPSARAALGPAPWGPLTGRP